MYRLLCVFLATLAFTVPSVASDEEDEGPGLILDTFITTYEVTETGLLGQYAYVDLGLPVIWATANIGADSLTDGGMVFAWGEYIQNNEYDWKTYKHSKDSTTFITKYCLNADDGQVDSLTTLEPTDDAATILWGKEWQTPTASDFHQLKVSCIWQWVDDLNGTGASGMLGTSRLNGCTIFLPATEYEEEDDKMVKEGWYWTATLGTGEKGTAAQFFFKNKGEGLGCVQTPRCYGRHIRAVMKPDENNF